jgi:hypothetical protein
MKLKPNTKHLIYNIYSLATPLAENREGCWWWHLMEHIHNNLMKLGGSLGNVPQKLKKTCYKYSIYFGS